MIVIDPFALSKETDKGQAWKSQDFKKCPSDHRSPLLANLPSHDPLKLMLSYPSPVECTAVILQPIRQCSRVIRVSRYLWDLPEISNYGWFPQRPIQSPTIHHLHHLDPSPLPPVSPSLNLSCHGVSKGGGEAASQHFWQGSRLFGRGARWLLAECGFWVLGRFVKAAPE